MSHQAPDLPSIASAADERTTLEDFLDYYRAVLVRKASGLTHDQLHTAVPPSNLTLGGLINHMALVEDGWFSWRLHGTTVEPWDSAPWEDDHDWELSSAPGLTVAELFDRFAESVARSRAAMVDVSLDQPLVEARANGETTSARWMMVHMIEEYARHCGHADYLREAVDGATGD